jgi:hypothetical protein
MNKELRRRRATISAIAPLRRLRPDPPEVSDMRVDGLLDAAYCLDCLAAGDQPDRARLISAALSLDVLVTWGGADRDIRDAAIGLNTLATGGTLALDAVGRLRARELAEAVRARAHRREPESCLPHVSRSSHFS